MSPKDPAPAGRRALVTGASSGIGKAIALRLLADGWEVVGVSRSRPSITDPGFRALQADLANGEAATRVARDAGYVQAFVHAAGLMRTGGLGELDAAHGEAMWRIHVDAATRIADVVLPAMARAGHGRVVLLGSRASQGGVRRSQYAASKSALLGLARSWALEVVAQGVTVNVISPGATDTPMLSDPGRAGAAPKAPPLGRLVRPEEVAALASYLLSPEAAPVTGQEIMVCGGASL